MATRALKRSLVGTLVLLGLLGAGVWVLGRESTLQALVQKLADLSGGQVSADGVSGSLYETMHLDHLSFKNKGQTLTVDDATVEWAPWQFFSSGIAISRLQAASVLIESKPSKEPASKPETLAAPFQLSVAQARIDKLVFNGQAFSGLRFALQGDAARWMLRDGAALSPWGFVTASASVGAVAPFVVDARGSLAGKGALLTVRAEGNLAALALTAEAKAGSALGQASLSLRPFEAVPLGALSIRGQHIDPGYFVPGAPGGRLALTGTARMLADGQVEGQLALSNEAALRPLDQLGIPLKGASARLAGSLTALRIEDALIDLGAAGQLRGSGNIEGPQQVRFGLKAHNLDLRALHSKLRSTHIAGDIELLSTAKEQRFTAALAQDGLRLDATALLRGTALSLERARLRAGSGSIEASGHIALDGERAFTAALRAEHADLSALGAFPASDLNLGLEARGDLADQPRLAAKFELKPSKLFKQTFTGKGSFNAAGARVSQVSANIALGANSLELQGGFGAAGEQLNWRIDARQLAVFHPLLKGSLTAAGAVTGSLDAPRSSFELDTQGLAKLQAKGEISRSARSAPFELKLAGRVAALNPAAFGAYPEGRINANFDASGRLGPDWRAALNLSLQDAMLQAAPLSGYAKFAAGASGVSSADLDLSLGANRLTAKGAFGSAREQLELAIDAPALADFGPQFAGQLRANARLEGTLDTPALKLNVQADKLRVFGHHHIQSLRAKANLGSGRGAADPLSAEIEVNAYQGPAGAIARARLASSGTRGAHTIELQARNQDFDASAELAGALAGSSWQGSLKALHNKGRYALRLQAPASLRVALDPASLHLDQLSLSDAEFQLPAGSIRIASFDKSGPRWRSSGRADAVPLAWIGQFSDAIQDNVSGELALKAQWQLDVSAPAGSAPALEGSLSIEREKGDLTVGADIPVVLGLSKLALRADVQNGSLRLFGDIDGKRLGHTKLDASLGLLAGRLSKDSPLSLAASADMGSIAWLAPLTGQPALELDGALRLALDGKGTLGTPQLNGSMSGEQLALRWADQGIKLSEGQLRAQLAGDQLKLERLSFAGPEGRVRADGSMRLQEGDLQMQLKLVAEQLELLARPDRTLVLSGSSTLTRDAKHFALQGKFRAERALIELAPQDRPTLSEDVIVLGKGGADKRAATPGLPLTVDIDADLGDDFRLKGLGLDAQLAGTLHIHAADRKPPRANGSIRALSGTYAAYGQKLSLERGVLTFSGAYDNPSLNILALRKRPDGEQLSESNVEAGVEVRGTALAPVAKLVSTPNVADSDKLAWLVLGHGMDLAAGQEFGVLSAAAGALLGGPHGGLQSRIASTFGVDEVGLSQARGLETTVVTVGKRLSQRAYLSFEQGASSATSLVKLRYKLNPRITLQLQTGANSALDVLYSWAFD